MWELSWISSILTRHSCSGYASLMRLHSRFLAMSTGTTSEYGDVRTHMPYLNFKELLQNWTKTWCGLVNTLRELMARMCDNGGVHVEVSTIEYHFFIITIKHYFLPYTCIMIYQLFIYDLLHIFYAFCWFRFNFTYAHFYVHFLPNLHLTVFVFRSLIWLIVLRIQWYWFVKNAINTGTIYKNRMGLSHTEWTHNLGRHKTDTLYICTWE